MVEDWKNSSTFGKKYRLRLNLKHGYYFAVLICSEFQDEHSKKMKHLDELQKELTEIKKKLTEASGK